MSQAGATRGYYQRSRAWWGEGNQERDVVDQVTFGLYYPDGGTDGELMVRWLAVGQSVFPQLTVFHSSWRILAAFADVLAILGKLEDTEVSPKKFCAMLQALGFEDRTKTVGP